MFRRSGWTLRRFRGPDDGQSTVEFALVTTAFLAMFIALLALWRFGMAGGLAGVAVDAASHSTADVTGCVKDAAVF